MSSLLVTYVGGGERSGRYDALRQCYLTQLELIWLHETSSEVVGRFMGVRALDLR